MHRTLLFAAACLSAAWPHYHAAAATECGVPSAKHPPSVRLVGGKLAGLKHGISMGQEAEPHSYPWAVIVNGCTGAIIGDRWVLTAAHCVANDKGKVVSEHVGNTYVALHDKITDWDKMYEAEKVHVPAGYNGDACGNGEDIAVVKLKETIEFNDEVRPICLPSASDNFRDQEGLMLLAAGWGRSNTNQTYTSKLQQVVMHVNKADCVRSYQDEKLKRICVTGYKHGEGICAGDSGSSLMHYKDGRYYTAGPLNCSPGDKAHCDPTLYHPAYYAHLPDYMHWVQGIMAQ